MHRSIAAIVLLVLTLASVRADAQVAARVNGRTITAAEVDAAITAKLFPLEQQIYALRKSALENLLTAVVLETEAAKRGVTLEKLRETLGSAPVRIEAAEIEKTYAEHAGAFGAMSADEARERIRLDLETQARLRHYRTAVEELKRASTIEVLLDEPRVPFETDGVPVRGNADAPVTITTFADYQCPWCKRSATALEQIRDAYGDQVAIVQRHLPLNTHAEAVPAARAAWCAGQQGRFWEMHDALFAADALSTKLYETTAAALDLDVQQFRACASGDASRLAVERDTEAARRLGITATPTFFVNGRIHRGAAGFDELRAAVARELALPANATASANP